MSSLSQTEQRVTLDDVIDAGYARPRAREMLKKLVKADPRQARIFLSLKKAGYPEKNLADLTKKVAAFDYTKLRQLLRHMLLHQIFQLLSLS